MMQLLRKLNERFAKTNQVWPRFNAHDGDRGYFSDMRDSGTICMLSSLKNSFEELSDLKKKLTRLEKSCKESQQIVSPSLSSAGHNLTYWSFPSTSSMTAISPTRRHEPLVAKLKTITCRPSN